MKEQVYVKQFTIYRGKQDQGEKESKATYFVFVVSTFKMTKYSEKIITLEKLYGGNINL